jgi:hypothetical protein
MDIDRVSTRVSRMWWRLGRLFEQAAVDAVEKQYHDTALKCGRMAEACYWQSTGDQDAASIKEALGS